MHRRVLLIAFVLAAFCWWDRPGVGLGGEDTLDGLLRTGVYFDEGTSPHFSFYAEHERQIGWGLWYDF